MVSQQTFDYLQRWLVEAMRPDFERNTREGREDSLLRWSSYNGKINKGIISKIWELFDRYICCGDDKRIRVKDDDLYVYNGRWFERVAERSFMKELVRRVLTEIGVSSTYRFYGATKIAEECMARILNTEDCTFVPNRRYVCFTNGVFDTKDGKLKSHHIRYATDVILDFEYNERASCLVWDIKVKEIIPDIDFRRAFQQFCGSLLVQREEMKIEYICYLYGTGSNGKSVLASAVANVFGQRYFSTFSPQQLFRNGDSMFNMKELQGKLLNVCDDLTATDYSGGEFKRFISGEALTGRSPYSKEFVKIQPPMMLCCTNVLPESADDSYGHHRRQLPIFTTRQQFIGSRRDPELTAKLSTIEARQRIFNWLYDGFRMLRNNNGNIELGDSIKDAMAQMVADSNPARRWAFERGFVYAKPNGRSDARWKSLKHWFADYEKFCADNGYTSKGNSRVVSSLFQTLGFEKDRWMSGTYFCVGVLRHDTDEKGEYIATSESQDIALEVEINNIKE